MASSQASRRRLVLGVAAALLAAAIGLTVAVGADGVFGDEVRLTDARLLAVGDVGGTPRPDLVFGQDVGLAGVVVVETQQPDGTFAAGPPLGSVARPAAAAVADLTGDGRPDLAALGDGGGTLYAGAADGSLAAAQALSTPTTITSAAAGDLTGDGRADLVVAGPGYGAVFPQRAVPPGGLGPAVPLGGFDQVDTERGRIVLARLDGDALPDVVIATTTGLAVALSPSGYLATPVPTSSPVTDFTAADLDGDGAVDLAAALQAGAGLPARVVLLHGNGDGTFAPERVIPAGDAPVRVQAGEVDGRPGTDLVVVNGGVVGGIPPDRFTVLAGHGDGTFDPPAPLGLTVTEPRLSVCCLHVVDLDGDGLDDLAFRNTALQGSSIATNKAFQPSPPAPAPGPGPAPAPDARDRTPPRLSLGTAPRRVSATARAIVLRASCDEACALTATGRVQYRVGRRLRTAALTPARATTAGGRAVSLSVRLPRRAVALARAALRARRAPTAVIRVSALDLAGNGAPARVLTLRIVAGRSR